MFQSLDTMSLGIDDVLVTRKSQPTNIRATVCEVITIAITNCEV